MLLWFVKIVPASSAKFITGMWNKAGLRASTIEGLPGRVRVLAPNPKTLLGSAPLSHFDCIRSFTRVPAEETLLHTIFGGSRTIPAWCTVTKRGRYKGDLGYVITSNQESGLLDVLVAPRDLKPLPRHLNDKMIGEDLHARRLFSQESYKCVESAPTRGRPTFIFQRRQYVSGLLLLQLPETQVRVLLTPSPHQIALHARSGINSPFVDDARSRYHQMFWKPSDRVVLNDISHFQLRAKLVSIDLENNSAVVESIVEMEQLVVPISALARRFGAIRPFPGILQNRRGSLLNCRFVTALGLLSPCYHGRYPFSDVPATRNSSLLFSQFGDAIVVVRGRWLGKRGIVGAVDLDKKILEVNAWADGERFFVPITHVAHESQVSERDETERYVGKEVLVIKNHYKGWRGTLRNVSQNKCVVAPGNAACITLDKNDFVVKGCNTTLGGLLLTHSRLLHVVAAFRRAEILATRQKTPPLSPPDASSIAAGSLTDAWTLDPDDSVRSPPLTKLDFMLYPEVQAALQTHHVVFKIEDAWRAGYVKRCCRTDIPDPLQSASGGPVPSSHLAISLTSRGAGGKKLFENIHEKYLAPYPPSQGRRYCMVIKAREEGQGETVATEAEIAWDRVIEVEVAISSC
ncbi:hypothetical protein JVT61DRAFT_12339 [Boletus reticuloceps]|uniref:Uncharacterized protein n=1 Tax=Boletus reticuloceps TaxID=495285 RepID=A0A8I3A430_9AGAM|nr:hypothetical protein JVT61DRAFT_12339 [Boletus reticuloceps]